MEAWALHNRDLTTQGDYWKLVLMLFSILQLHLESNTFISQCDLFKNILKLVSLYKNMKILVLFRKTCVPDHVQIQLPVGVINIWLAPASTHPGIPNRSNSRSYINLFWLNNNIGSVWCDIIILVLSSVYLHFNEYDQLTCSENVIHHSFLR